MLTLSSRLSSITRGRWRILIIKKAKRVVIYLVALLILAIAILPVMWTVTTALMSGAQAILLPPKLIPSPVYWGNFGRVVRSLDPSQPVLNWLKNSIVLTSINIVGQIFFATVAGYGFARFRFRLRKFMFVVLMASTIVPTIVKIVPQYKMFARWGWTNTYLPLTLPTWFGGAFLTFLFYQYFSTIPRVLDESALLDGADQLQIFLKIILPLSKPILATAVVLTFMSNWNNFFEPFIYLHDKEKFTMAVVLGYMRPTAHGASLSPYLAAYTLFWALPVIVVFFIFQRHFVKGIQLSIAKE